MTESFPRQQARTRRFSLGLPRSFTVAPDGSRVAFLRSKGADDPVTCLWQLHVETGQEELVADPATLEPAGEDVSPQEKARRERAREQAGGIVGFAADRALSVAAFALAGRVYVAGLGPSGDEDDAGVREAAVGQTGPHPVGALAPAFDPRPDPTGTRVAYVHQGALHVTRIDGEARGAGDTSTADAANRDGADAARGDAASRDGADAARGDAANGDGADAARGDAASGADAESIGDGDASWADGAGVEDLVVAGPAGAPGLSYGAAEFIAAEEMGRMRGYWWAPDGGSLLVARVDETRVQRWHIADPANPARSPAAVAYPAAGTSNADVSLLLASLDGRRAEVDIDWAAFPYLVTVAWEAGGDPLIVVQSRDQRVMRLLTA
ncbi:MAG TPA: DPP IV N-terminal domain-containing protein, partial [Streptosporangiaceae bacterium]